MPLEEVFSLTPINSFYYQSVNQRADLYVYGAYFYPKWGTIRSSFDAQHANNELFFRSHNAADPAIDYLIWQNRLIAPHMNFFCDLSSMGEHKELALVFKYEADSESHILIYTQAELLENVTLIPDDNQFLMEVESLDPLELYFIHSRGEGSPYGGNWYFKGITGYVV